MSILFSLHALPIATFATFSGRAREFLIYYREFFVYQWQHMTPEKYAYLLCSIAFVGWIMMRSRLK